MSFAGIVVAFGVPTPGGDPRELLGDAMLFLAAAAWGATYTASCVDEASLRAFAVAHLGRGPENTCADGFATGGMFIDP